MSAEQPSYVPEDVKPTQETDNELELLDDEELDITDSVRDVNLYTESIKNLSQLKNNQPEIIKILVEVRNHAVLELFLQLKLAEEVESDEGKTIIEIDQDNFAKQWLAKGDEAKELRKILNNTFSEMDQSSISAMFFSAGCEEDFCRIVGSSLVEFMAADKKKERKQIRKETKKAIHEILDW